MGTISKVRLPDNNEHNIHDSRITTANAHVIPFGKCDSTSTSTVYTATVPGITALEDGTCVYLTNGVVTSASGFTLNINSLGALPCYQTMAAESRVTTVWNKNYTFLFVYNSQRVDGGCWDIYYGYANALATTMRTASMTKPMAAITYRYKILFSSADDKKWVPATTSSSTNATSARTVCQTPINPFGDIRYYTSSSSVAADATPAASTLAMLYTCTLGYSFNRTGAALTLTANAPVYIKCAPQADGSAIIDSDTPYVQALPSTDDSKIYIFLGVAYSETAVEILPYHPVYYYKDSAVRLWTNAASSGGGSAGTLDTTATTAQSPSASESLGGSVTLHKIAKTGTYSDLIGTPTIPTVPTISTDISSDKTSDTKTASPKAVYDDAHPAVGSSQPAGGMLPNVLYNLGTLTGTVTISFASASDANIENEWKFTFDTSSTAPTITWPNAITTWAGNCLSSNVPNIAASKHYEVSVVGGYAIIIEY